MRREDLTTAIEKESGLYLAAEPLWNEIEEAVGRFEGEDGENWVTGQDDVMRKLEYYVGIKREYDEDCDSWDTDITLYEMIIEDRQTHKRWHIVFDSPVRSYEEITARNLKAIVTGKVNEEFYLIKDGKYVGFNHLEELVGSDYDNLNDDLMSGDYSEYHKYELLECVMTIQFVAEDK